MSTPAKSSPKDAQVMSAILKDMGVPEYEPRLINQMLEFTYRYVTDVLDDAKLYSNHANRKNIDMEDIKLSVQMKMDHSFTSPPPRDLLMEIARQKNSQALPLVKPYTGPRLPPDRFCLSAPNFKLRPPKKPRGGVSYNQRLGTQVKSVASPSLTLVTKGLTQPTVTILNKQSVGGMAKTVGSTPKPMIRVNPAIGASGLSRIITTGNTAPGSSSLSSLSSLTPSSSLSLSSNNSSLSHSSSLDPHHPQPTVLTVNPLKRKQPDDDDYDNL